MKNRSVFLLISIFSILFLSCVEPVSRNAPLAANDQPPMAPTELMINLISDPMSDPHSGLMGLHLAQKALKGGKDVTVFLNVHGVKLLSAEADSLVFHEENLKSVLMELIQDGGVVRVCPHCAEVHEITADDFPEGVQLMKDSLMMDKLNSNLTVFTY
jgi:predicted peroxiredoxin